MVVPSCHDHCCPFHIGWLVFLEPFIVMPQGTFPPGFADTRYINMLSHSWLWHCSPSFWHCLPSFWHCLHRYWHCLPRYWHCLPRYWHWTIVVTLHSKSTSPVGIHVCPMIVLLVNMHAQWLSCWYTCMPNGCHKAQLSLTKQWERERFHVCMCSPQAQA